MHTNFLKAGHLPTLLASFLYFDLSFMVWVMLGPLAVLIAKDLDLNAAQKGLMVATPVLAGAVLRVVGGVLVDQITPKTTGIIAQIVVIAGLLAAWYGGIHGFSDSLLLGIVLGVAGASFAVALPLASQWYPPEHQGTALGIAGAGNSGTVLASLFAPGLAVLFGWQNVIGLAVIPLIIVLALFVLLARTSPRRQQRKPLVEYLKLFAIDDAWWFMFFYSITFGGFVGLASSLPIYFNDQYGLTPVNAGYFTAACVFVGSLLRPVGGAIADRIGGITTLTIMYAVAAAALFLMSRALPGAVSALCVLLVGMGALGMGNGAVFQLVPQRFGHEMGIMTGLVGMTGGIGGFYLASSLGLSKQLTGSYELGFLLFAGLALIALGAITFLKRRWRMTWAAALGASRI